MSRFDQLQHKLLGIAFIVGQLLLVMGERAPVFGLICTITGLGIGIGMLPANARIAVVTG